MKRINFFVMFLLIITLLTGCCKKCCNYLVIDIQKLHDKVYVPSVFQNKELKNSTVLYVDRSTCVINAVKDPNSILTKLKSFLSVVTDELVMIEGNNFRAIQLPSSSTDKIQEIWGNLNEIENEDIPFTEIKEAVKKICNSNQQAILITDSEYYTNGHISDAPFMYAGFKEWLKNGHCVYIIIEPYDENGHGFFKKRFYYCFTDEGLENPISKKIESEISKIKDSEFSTFKLTNSDLFVQKEEYEKEIVDENLTYTVEEKNGFQLVTIDDPWDAIREFVLKLDEYGNLIDGETPLPIIRNLIFVDGENFLIDEIKIVATNITTQYQAIEDSLITPNIIDMSEAFTLDKNDLKNKKLSVFVNDKIFNYLNDEDGNLIRLDFVVKEARIRNYDEQMFIWKSQTNNEDADCIKNSIEYLLIDKEIVPTTKDRRIIHTIFLKTECY